MSSSGSSLPIPPDARDPLHTFCVHDVRFLVIGAHAVGYWGQPRATGDFDLVRDKRATGRPRDLFDLDLLGGR